MLLERLGIIGDVHCQHRTLESALEFLKSQNVERILCTGDIADGDMAQTGDLKRCCELLQEANVAVVRGNHDRWFLNDEYRDAPDAARSTPDGDEAIREYLRSLPKTLSFQTCAGKLWLFHGVAENDFRWLEPEEFISARADDADIQAILRGGYSFVLAGHTHIRQVERVGNLVCLNGGTLRPEYSPCISVLDLKMQNIRFWNFKNDGFHDAEIFPFIN